METLNGAAYCWGYNYSGQAGIGGPTGSTTPIPPTMVSGLSSGVAQVSPGAGHTCAVMNSGSVYCWGSNTLGQLGDGSNSTSTSPVQVYGIGDAIAVTTGWYHSCAVHASGTVDCWGADYVSNYGAWPYDMGLTDIVKIVAAGPSTCALDISGAVWCWGGNYAGQLGNGTYTDSPYPVLVGLSGAANAISGGWGSYCATSANGTAQCWGMNSAGELGAGYTSSSEPNPVAVTVVSDIVEMSVSLGYACALLDNDGHAYCWGSNYGGQLGDGTTTSSLTAVQQGVAGGAYPLTHLGHSSGDVSCGIHSHGGTAFCWGNNSTGGVGNYPNGYCIPTVVQ